MLLALIFLFDPRSRTQYGSKILNYRFCSVIFSASDLIIVESHCGIITNTISHNYLYHVYMMSMKYFAKFPCNFIVTYSTRISTSFCG